MRDLWGALAVAAVLAGCLGSSADAPMSVTVVVTRDFGQTLLLEREIAIFGGASVIEALQAVATVERSYGGGFVQAIDGVGSGFGRGERLDWFYYVNGLHANVGAAVLELRDGDAVQWDYHSWEYSLIFPAFTGAFPRPFVQGPVRLPVEIGHAAGLAEQAAALADALRQAGTRARARPLAELAADPVARSGDAHLILLGSFADPLISELGAPHASLGLFARAHEAGVELLDARGRPHRVTAGAVVQTTQNPWADGGVGAMRAAVLLIVGPDPDAVRAAATVLSDAPERLRHRHSVVLEGDSVEALP
ncbi:MAG TPA: DUF4430 domain-containing protein [Candidatus Thermoplasmatota archaeon]|nr:DUF4430 domain-containing protein [Candidatus Thermoplasmatota archaeon]